MNQQELNEKIAQIEDKVTAVNRLSDKRIYLDCEVENSYAVNKFLFEQVPARFAIVTGIDTDDCFELLYHYSYDPLGCVITLKVFIRDKENPEVESIAQFLPGAEWIEREMHDVLGIEFRNHPDMRRLILADDWPEGVYPLRKQKKT